MVDSFYEALGVSHNATQLEIDEAYGRLAAKWHPDSDQGNHEAKEKLRLAEEAYAVLRDFRLRSMYDRALAFFRQKSKAEEPEDRPAYGYLRLSAEEILQVTRDS